MSEVIKATKNETTVESEFNFGEDLDQMCQKFGNDVVFSNARQNIKVGIQALMRRMIEKGENQDSINQTVANYVPGMSGQKADPIEKFKQKWSKLDQDEREKVLNELKSMVQ